MRPRPSAQIASICGHAWEASNLRASQCCAYASRFDHHRCAAGKTRRSSPPGRRPRSETSDRFGRDAGKYQRPREVARRPHGALAAGSCSTYRFPWERVSAELKESVQSLPDDFSSFCSISVRKMAMSALHKETLPHDATLVGFLHCCSALALCSAVNFTLQLLR